MATIFRKDKSRAHWINEIRMAEVVENKGKLWRTMGVVCSGEIYYSIEETLCGGQNLSLCIGLKAPFFNNNASEEKKVWGKAP